MPPFDHVLQRVRDVAAKHFPGVFGADRGSTAPTPPSGFWDVTAPSFGQSLIEQLEQWEIVHATLSIPADLSLVVADAVELLRRPNQDARDFAVYLLTNIAWASIPADLAPEEAPAWRAAMAAAIILGERQFVALPHEAVKTAQQLDRIGRHIARAHSPGVMDVDLFQWQLVRAVGEMVSVLATVKKDAPDFQVMHETVSRMLATMLVISCYGIQQGDVIIPAVFTDLQKEIAGVDVLRNSFPLASVGGSLLQSTYERVLEASLRWPDLQDNPLAAALVQGLRSAIEQAEMGAVYSAEVE